MHSQDGSIYLNTSDTSGHTPDQANFYINNRRHMSLLSTIPASRSRTIEDLLQALRAEARSYFAALKNKHSHPELMSKGIIVTLEDIKADSRFVLPDGNEYENYVRQRVENAQLPQPKEMSRVVQVHLTTYSGKGWMDEAGTVNLWRRLDALAEMEALSIWESGLEEDSGVRRRTMG
jgi:hypothetical protein